MFVVAFASLTFYQCEQKEVSELANGNQNLTGDVSSTEANSDGEMVLGKKLENPYNTKNMEKALNSLKKKGQKGNLEKIEPNYVYVRLLAKTDEEYNAINSDSTIDTFEYPLDYEIVKQGNKYKDKSVGNNKFTWIYCAVPLSKKFDPKIKIEILDELYLPFGNGKEKSTNFEKNNTEFLKSLEEESLILTGNKNSNNKSGRGITEWYASGRIRVWDDRVKYNDSNGQLVADAGYVPVPGCEVRANRWFTTKSALTSDNGTFSINHGWANGDAVNYSIKWDRNEFDIRSGSYGQAYYNGPSLIGVWNLEITESIAPDNYIYAHVHRGAYQYYYKNYLYSIQQPPTTNNSILGGKMHLGTLQGSGRAHYFSWNSTFMAAEIRLPFDLTIDDSREIFCTTIHELAHSSHWDLGFTTANYGNFNSSKLAESWAQAVGWFITRNVYSALNSTNVTLYDLDSEQSLLLTNIPNERYTPLFIDLIDNYNQNTSGSNGRPNENINGYNLGQLENFLSARPTNWTDYRDYLISNNGSLSDTDAKWIFDNYDKD